MHWFPGPPNQTWHPFRVCLWLSLLSQSLSLSLSLSRSPSLCLCRSLTLSPSLSPAVAGQGPGPRATGRQSFPCLFSTLAGRGPSRAAVQESSPPPCSSHGRSHTGRSSRHILSRAAVLRVDGRGDNFLLGSSYRTACPGGPAPHQGCALMPPLPAVGLDLPGSGPSAAHPHLRAFAPVVPFTWSLLSPDLPRTFSPEASGHTPPPQDTLPVSRPGRPGVPYPGLVPFAS